MADLSYIENLPEVGDAVRHKLASIREKTLRIAALREELARLEHEVWDKAAKLDDEVEELWTKAEVAAAKATRRA